MAEELLRWHSLFESELDALIAGRPLALARKAPIIGPITKGGDPGPVTRGFPDRGPYTKRGD